MPATYPPATAGQPQTLAALLHEGPLRPVFVLAEELLGHPFDPSIGHRWATNGRRGVTLPTLRGRRRTRVTTAACLRAWLEATSDEAVACAAAPKPAAAAPRDDATDAALASFGLGRKGSPR